MAIVLASPFGVACKSSTPSEPSDTPSGSVTAEIPPGLSPTLTSMLQGLPSYITRTLQEQRDSLPRNPQNATWINAKIALLEKASLYADIVNGRRWIEGQAVSINGGAVPIVILFPLESMRGEGATALSRLDPIIPLLEAFFDVPFPTQTLRVWYGFVVGNSGGGGAIYSEDRTTYESRTPPSRLPFDAILGHEVGHSYIGHESMNQFLELYGYNLTHGSSANLSSWTFTRSWTPGAASNTGIAALLDIFQLVGFETMRSAYRAVYPLRPPYGQALQPAVIDMFTNQVASSQRPAVSEKLNKVGF
jgi:hypothetical protein